MQVRYPSGIVASVHHTSSSPSIVISQLRPPHGKAIEAEFDEAETTQYHKKAERHLLVAESLSQRELLKCWH